MHLTEEEIDADVVQAYAMEGQIMNLMNHKHTQLTRNVLALQEMTMMQKSFIWTFQQIETCKQIINTYDM
jgi:hypothetical protein